MPYHLAQVNIGRLRFSLEDPRMAEFARALDPINQIAERSPGFVWRLKDDQGRPSSFLGPVFGPGIFVNMSVWESLESLKHYAFQSGHSAYFRRRADWFEPLGRITSALWWVRIGEHPTLEDARARYDHLLEHGPSEYAFGLKDSFDAPLE